MNWIDQYERKRTTAEDAVKCIKSGDRVLIHPGCCTSLHLIDAMVARKDELENVELLFGHDAGEWASMQYQTKPS